MSDNQAIVACLGRLRRDVDDLFANAILSLDGAGPPAPACTNLHRLTRIAEALNTSVDELAALPAAAPVAGDATHSSADALFDAFGRIKDPEGRKLLLDLARLLAESRP